MARMRNLIPTMLALVVAVAADATWGQGFSLQPTRVEVSGRPNEQVEVTVRLRNAHESAQIIDLSLADLTQHTDGSWRIYPPDADISRMASALEWTQLSSDTIELEPLGPGEVTLGFQIPARARGVYIAALLAQTRPPEGLGGVRVTIRFLVPIFIEVEGRPERQQIKLDDLTMVFRDAEEGRSPTTLASMHIVNEGRTYSRVRGDLRIERQSGDRWRSVSQVAIGDRGIIPGVALQLGDDLQRRLPSGTYRLRGTLYVDGRRITPLDKEIEFEGDPDVDSIAYDTALILEPEQVAFDATPGATRTNVVQVENPAEDPLEVRAEAVVPAALRGVALGELRGDELSAAEWVQVRPETFTIRGGGRQNLRVITRVPREDVDHARYYAQLVLHGTYADGQSAGTTQSLLTVSNAAVTAEQAVQANRLALASDEGSRYIVQTQFSNVGNVHLNAPRAEAEVLGTGARSVLSTRLGGETGIMLPLGVRQFGGELDFSDVEPGQYILLARLRYGDGGTTVKRLPIRVETEEDGARSVVVLDDADPDALELENVPADAEESELEAEGEA